MAEFNWIETVTELSKWIVARKWRNNKWYKGEPILFFYNFYCLNKEGQDVEGDEKCYSEVNNKNMKIKYEYLKI